MSLCDSFERLHRHGFRGRRYRLWYWRLHIVVDDDELLVPLPDVGDVEAQVSDQSPGPRTRAVDDMWTGISEKCEEI